jgi:hypothetical protein
MLVMQMFLLACHHLLPLFCISNLGLLVPCSFLTRQINVKPTGSQLTLNTGISRTLGPNIFTSIIVIETKP